METAEHHRTNINLHASDVTYLRNHYGHGWTERVRDIVHTFIQNRKRARDDAALDSDGYSHLPHDLHRGNPNE